MADVLPRWRPPAVLPSSSRLWPSSRQCRGHQRRAARPSSSPSTDPRLLAAPSNTHDASPALPLPPSLAGAVLLLLALLLPPWCVPAPCEQGGSPFVLACWLLAPHPTLRPIFICLLSLGLGLGAEGRREGSLATSPQPGVSRVP